MDDLLDVAEVEVVPFDRDQAALARQAYIDFGRGSGHSAKVNLGDCCVYALHRTTGEPVLSKGTDFAAAGVPLPLTPRGSAYAKPPALLRDWGFRVCGVVCRDAGQAQTGALATARDSSIGSGMRSSAASVAGPALENCFWCSSTDSGLGVP